jgi:hypothetical protein
LASKFQIREWVTAMFRRAAFPELRPISRAVAKALGDTAVLNIQGDNALITTPPFALLLTAAGGDTLQAYCSVYDGDGLDIGKALRFDFHQHGQPFRKSSWVWFPRLSPDGATSYKRRRLRAARNEYEWSVTRVEPAGDTHHEARNRKALIEAMGAQIARDHLLLRQRLVPQ